MVWLGAGIAVLALAIGRTVGAVVLVGALLLGATTGGSAPLLVVTLGTGLVSMAYLGWFASVGHPQLRAASVSKKARRTFLGYGLAIFAVAPLLEWAVYRGFA